MKIKTMRKNLRILTLIFSSMSLLSCGQEKMYLNEEELADINIYEVGDKLIFKNAETGETDTSRITKKEIYHENYDWFRHDGYQPQIAEIRYTNEKLIYDDNQEGGLIARKKRTPNDKIEFAVTFLYSLFTAHNELKVLDRLDLNLTDKSLNNVVVYYKEKNKRHKPKDDFKPQKLYWDSKYGIIKYETYGGDVWERINW
ncbi:MAG: hypothetical protein CR994_00900 [Maribacter sp.]|nr:MAG: hypothetical protein CR994_00900 [Maribacter sp.]